MSSKQFWVGFLVSVFVFWIGIYVGSLNPFPWIKAWNLIVGKDSTSAGGTVLRTHDGEWFPLPDGDNDHSLKGLGYLSGYESKDKKGVVKYDQTQALQGLNFYVMADGPTARLMDMEGRIIHEWSFPWQKAFPDRSPQSSSNYWREAFVYPNGDLLVLYEESSGIARITRNSELRWSHPMIAHHDVWISAQGEIYVLRAKPGNVDDFRIQEQYQGQVLKEYITVISPGGEVKREYSIYNALKRSSFAPLLNFVHASDLFHTNTLEILQDVPSNLPNEFKKGRALISIRRLNFVGLMDLEKESIVWGRVGRTQGQHDPRLLSNGHMLIYDNRSSKFNENYESAYSRIIEVNPNNWEITWSLSGQSDVPFYSRCCGRNQPLSNGNILITDSDSGRAFEVTREKRVVWEYFIPERLENKNNYIPAMYGMTRLSRDYFGDWLKQTE